MLTALQLTQEVAKRLGIMLPTTIVQPENPDSSLIDYDANLIVSCLQAQIASLMTLHEFNNMVSRYFVDLTDTRVKIVPKTNGCQDIVLSQLENFVSKIEGDGIVISKIEESSKTSSTVMSDRYVYRQFTSADYLRFYSDAHFSAISDKAHSYGYDDQETFNPETPSVQRQNYRTDAPSAELVGITRSTNLGSGFYIARDGNQRRLIISNNMIALPNVLTQNAYALYFIYKSQYAVLDATGAYKERITADTDVVSLPDELVILGALINFKGYYGLDYSLELASQKAFIDKTKENQENLQLTHLYKKQYVQPTPLGA